ncbi:acyltransferase family protein [Thalassoglobus polymorphus]|uniref:Acyltransferase family protein n=1 Tax=Thalassoglobus polymorphus TaxID=2527994 RepID=A0A517QHE6_9PLAN|nr:acyltransferase family protein [Thalassoglobus polymorphus]QDT31048.1 Acyltransferase family protein [Thalassoglobus polymorphus]
MNQGKRNFGFDLLRAIAIVFVLVQHQLSIMGLIEDPEVQRISLGQIGVSIFLAISGGLAALDKGSPSSWLWRRLTRIYPEFWIVTILSFLATWLTGYKTFGAFQFISQLIGTGLFTHPEDLINLATWFVSLILLLYVLTFLAKSSGREKLCICMMAVSSACLVSSSDHQFLATHSLVFFLSYLLSGPSKSRAKLLVLISLIALSIVQNLFLYPIIAIGLCHSLQYLKSIPGVLMWLSKYSYEIFLCHGIFLVGSQRFFGDTPYLSVPLGITASLVFSFYLKYVVERFTKRLQRKRVACV